MKVDQATSRDVKVARPQQPLRDVAKIMADEDIGSMPVGDNDQFVGMITDRDIAVRAVAQGLGPETLVSKIMSTDVKYCFVDEDVERVAQNLREVQLHRLPVVNREKRLVGILALADLANKDQNGAAAIAVEGISRPAR